MKDVEPYIDPQELIAKMKSERGCNNPATWFLEGQVTSTLKVPITPGGALINRLNTALKDVCGPDGGHTKIVEEAGTMVSHLVSARPQLGCSFTKKCLIGKYDCQAPNI